MRVLPVQFRLWASGFNRGATLALPRCRSLAYSANEARVLDETNAAREMTSPVVRCAIRSSPMQANLTSRIHSNAPRIQPIGGASQTYHRGDMPLRPCRPQYEPRPSL